MKNIFLANVARSIALNKKKARYNITKLNAPSLWYFTDEDKTKDIINILHRIPSYSGIVIRNYCSKDRKTIIKDVLKIAKRKNFIVLIASHPRVHGNINGLHLPKWEYKCRRNTKDQIISVSAHSLKDKRKIINTKADIIFLSSVFHTNSHPKRKHLGIIRFGLLARSLARPVIALGGINNKNIKKLKNFPISGVAAIEALKQRE